MKKKRTIFGFTLITLFVFISTIPLVVANVEGIGIDVGQDAITITSDKITFKIIDDQPHFVWWNGNQSSADEMYKVQFKTIKEFFGNDTILDSRDELNGIEYNLVSSEWSTEIVEEETHATVKMTLSGLASGAEIQFIVKIFTEEQPINGTDQVIDAFTEVKIDIIVNNWVFSENAQGLTFQIDILEAQKRNRVRIRNGTNADNGNQTRTLQFLSAENGNRKVAYFEWTTFAEVYNETKKIANIPVGTAFFNPLGGISDPINPDGGMIHLWLSYPKYGNSLKLVHDPLVGINSGAFNMSIYFYPVIGGLLATFIVTIISRKRRKDNLR
jgi:hypothetical protein